MPLSDRESTIIENSSSKTLSRRPKTKTLSRRPKTMDEPPDNNVEKLRAYWEQCDVRGLLIEKATCHRNRCLISLGEVVLLCDGVSDYTSDVKSLPSLLLERSIVWNEGRAKLQLTTQNGSYSISCGKVRLIDSKNLSWLVG